MIYFKAKPNNSLVAVEKCKSAGNPEEDIKDVTVRFLRFNKHAVACVFSLNPSDSWWIKIMKDTGKPIEVYVSVLYALKHSVLTWSRILLLPRHTENSLFLLTVAACKASFMV